MPVSVDKPTSNCVSIRLTEPVVFIRGTDYGRVNTTDPPDANARTSVVRGLLTVCFVKPTRVTSIDVHLSAKTSTSWPEGLGSRRVEVAEDHEVYSASTVYFQAGNPPRRNVSLGPGVIPHDEEIDWASNARSRSPSQQPVVERPGALRNADSRRFSTGPSMFSQPTSHPPTPRLDPTPPYTPEIPRQRPPLSRLSTSASCTHAESSAGALQDFRNALQLDLDHRSVSTSRLNGLASSSSSMHSFRAPSMSLSRRPSVEDVPENDLPRFTPTSTHPHSPDLSAASRTLSPLPSPNPQGRSPLPSPNPQAQSPVLERGRRKQRFSFASAILDAVRSRSPKHEERGRGRSQAEVVRTPEASRSRGGSPEGRPNHGSSRSTLSRISDMLKLDHDHHSHSHHNNNPHSQHHRAAERGEKTQEFGSESGEKWKLFKKGTYTFPISFAIPGGSPPSLRCQYGSVSWRLKASVHRPGAFKSKLTAARSLTVVAYPPEDTTEETENIIVERQWNDQLQYLIAISGKSFHIGGTIPVSFSLMPLAKMKVHRISVLLEERVEYHTMMKRVARADPATRLLLLSLKNEGPGHILPLESDDREAFSKSPFRLVSPPNSTMEESELAASFMGPGPWSFHHDLELNMSCQDIHFSNKNKKSNITVSHALKIVMRVERGDDVLVDPKTGRRKMFDIVVQAPVHILSCRCDPRWTTLPSYTERFNDEVELAQGCPCQERASSGYQKRLHRTPSVSSASSAETFAIHHHPSASSSLRSALLAQNTQFERLVSGLESESGEAPPSYDSLTSVNSR